MRSHCMVDILAERFSNPGADAIEDPSITYEDYSENASVSVSMPDSDHV